MQVIKSVIINILFSAVFCCSFLSPKAQTTSAEYQLKAVFLFNFTQFIDWPENSFDAKDSPLVIGVLGKNPFGKYLEEVVAGEKKNGRPVVVRYFDDGEDFTGCHLLYVNLPEAKKRKSVIESCQGKNILTVCDAGDFTRQGGMIRFFTVDKKIRFQINLASTKQAELVISSKLLRIADIYEPSSQ